MKEIIFIDDNGCKTTFTGEDNEKSAAMFLDTKIKLKEKEQQNYISFENNYNLSHWGTATFNPLEK